MHRRQVPGDRLGLEPLSGQISHKPAQGRHGRRQWIQVGPGTEGEVPSFAGAVCVPRAGRQTIDKQCPSFTIQLLDVDEKGLELLRNHRERSRFLRKNTHDKASAAIFRSHDPPEGKPPT